MTNSATEAIDKNTEYLKALQAQFQEVERCFNAGGHYGIQCAGAVTEKYMRNLSFMKNLIYPWRNFDWDYQQFVKNNYDPSQLGASGDGTITAIMNNVTVMLKLINGLLMDANPNIYSSASNPGSWQNDLVNCYKMAGGLSCQILNLTRQSYLSQGKPYDSSFFDKPLEGEYSSSYFVQVGTCPSKIEDEATCTQKGFTWIPNPLYQLPEQLRGPDTKPGSCYKGQYSYINNQPGLKVGQLQDLKGLIPSLANDMINISPDKLAGIAMGYNVPGFESQKCDETFIGKRQSLYPNYYYFYWMLLVILIVVMLIC